ncbi:MAG: hypothetical protein HRT61_23645 [Ekhidna sp.]|nr:hypothetical protein [Ekhidna sp.]
MHSAHEVPQCYAVASGEPVKRFKVSLRNGNTVSISYSQLPTFSLVEGTTLYIVAHELEIEISGRNLVPLLEDLNAEEVIFMRESYSQVDDLMLDTFIERIVIIGKYIRT